MENKPGGKQGVQLGVRGHSTVGNRKTDSKGDKPRTHTAVYSFAASIVMDCQQKYVHLTAELCTTDLLLSSLAHRCSLLHLPFRGKVRAEEKKKKHEKATPSRLEKKKKKKKWEAAWKRENNKQAKSSKGEIQKDASRSRFLLYYAWRRDTPQQSNKMTSCEKSSVCSSQRYARPAQFSSLPCLLYPRLPTTTSVAAYVMLQSVDPPRSVFKQFGPPPQGKKHTRGKKTGVVSCYAVVKEETKKKQSTTCDRRGEKTADTAVWEKSAADEEKCRGDDTDSSWRLFNRVD